MRAHLVLNILNELGKTIKCEACYEFNKFNNLGAQFMLDIYHMT